MKTNEYLIDTVNDEGYKYLMNYLGTMWERKIEKDGFKKKRFIYVNLINQTCKSLSDDPFNPYGEEKEMKDLFICYPKEFISIIRLINKIYNNHRNQGFFIKCETTNELITLKEYLDNQSYTLSNPYRSVEMTEILQGRKELTLLYIFINPYEKTYVQYRSNVDDKMDLLFNNTNVCTVDDYFRILKENMKN